MRKALDRSRLAAVYDRVAGRYDLQHGLLTARADERGRRLLVERAVETDDRVLDCGAGTGSTALLAARRAGSSGQVVLFDLSAGMLDVARRRTAQLGLHGRMSFSIGDMTELPFADDSFDVALSTYSMCPLYDPVRGALEMYRVVKPGGRLGIAHSTTPEQPLLKWLADRVESVVWRFPAISLGCRTVSVLPALETAGCTVAFRKRVGVPLWPFLVFVVEKPLKAA
jgi:demethylmenaquinone methyltransferase/2-methoxy-6-polyprenyl-1,4-benzoquinol methylase